jgi:DNA invertase Pin-like site-specific DNA recombinase/lambda repressor-like predicted transcriptional regulator
MGNALVVQRYRLPQSQKGVRAAQYVRMSTDQQRYSIENQAAVLATYARLHNLTIVQTYRDAGLSGLRLKNRTGLIRLLDDVQSGRADFGHILVYDISRWGRFQDTDEAAHYEFICKKAGIKIAYCAEQFDNDGTMMSSILKNLKRVMAAEFSRELSVKVHAGLVRVAALGFRPGGPLGYGLRREMIDENRLSKGFLRRGQQKNLKTDRVVVRPGPSEEVAVVQQIFAEYVEKRKSASQIARRLNRDGVPNHHGRPWTRMMVIYLLRNENYIGNIVYNRVSFRLREHRIKNPPEQWVRADGAITPAIDQDVFERAKRRMTLRWRHLNNDELLSRLKSLLAKEGRLSEKIINGALGVPAINVYADRFGSLRNAYRLIGYDLKWDFDWIDRKAEFNEALRGVAADLIASLNKAGFAARFEPGVDVLTIEDHLAISLRLARSWQSPDPGKPLVWTINRRLFMPMGYIIAIRLGRGNNAVLDYLFLPTSEMTGIKIRFTEVGLLRFEDHLFTTLVCLAKAVSNELICRPRTGKKATTLGRASRSMPRRLRPETKGCSKARTKSGRAQH